MGVDTAGPSSGIRRPLLELAGLGRLTGKLRRGVPLSTGSRLWKTAGFAPPVNEERHYRLVDALDAVAAETGRGIPQIALNWLLQRPTVSSVLIGAPNEQQLRESLGAGFWTLKPDQLDRLDTACAMLPPYPYYSYWSGMFAEHNPAHFPFTVPTESPA